MPRGFSSSLFPAPYSLTPDSVLRPSESRFRNLALPCALSRVTSRALRFPSPVSRIPSPCTCILLANRKSSSGNRQFRVPSSVPRIPSNALLFPSPVPVLFLDLTRPHAKSQAPVVHDGNAPAVDRHAPLSLSGRRAPTNVVLHASESLIVGSDSD